MKYLFIALLLALTTKFVFADEGTPDGPYPQEESGSCETYEPDCIRDNDDDGYEDNEDEGGEDFS